MPSPIQEDTIGATRFNVSKATGWRVTLSLAATSLGVIYGDIGTSPLYVFNAIFPSSGVVPTEEDTLGAVSAIIWAITLVPLLKYCFIALEFGTRGAGEGGPFAVYSSIYPPEEREDDDRALTSYTTTSVRPNGPSFLDRPFVKGALWLWVLFGTCLTISDGLLTPAVSVTSAVEGIAVAAPKVLSSVVPISIVILLLLFLFQGLGTRRVGMVFAPVVAIWLALIGIGGIINVSKHPGIFRAFDPSRAVMLFVRTRNYDLLSGVLLAITGVEAMFANLGSFSKNSIRLGFGAYAYPCLVLAYLGQGARLILDAEAVISNVFYQTIPGGTSGGFWWVTWVFAVLATVVASQAMITATFSLVQQLTGLKAIPTLKIIHTDDTQEGQVFIPFVNALIMIGTIALTGGFGTNANLTNAYGFAVSGVLIVTTSILAIAMVRLKHLPIIVAVVFFLSFGFIDGLFFGASLKKVPHGELLPYPPSSITELGHFRNAGAWFPLGLAVLLCIFFQFYSWARGLETKFDASHRYRLQEVISRSDVYDEKEHLEADPVAAVSTTGGNEHVATGIKLRTFNETLKLVDGATPLSRLPVFAFFHNPSGNILNGAPHSFSAFVKSYPSLPQVSVFLNIRRVGVPHTTPAERYIVSRVRSFDGIYIATLRLGYRDIIDMTDLDQPIKERIVQLEAIGQREGDGREEGVVERIALIDDAQQRAVTHVLPHFHVLSDQSIGNKVVRYCRTFLIESLYRRLKVNFDEHDEYKFGTEDNVLRMGVNAAL